MIIRTLIAFVLVVVLALCVKPPTSYGGKDGPKIVKACVQACAPAIVAELERAREYASEITLQPVENHGATMLAVIYRQHPVRNDRCINYPLGKQVHSQTDLRIDVPVFLTPRICMRC